MPAAPPYAPVPPPRSTRRILATLTTALAAAAADRAAVEKILPSCMPIGTGTAALVNLNVFPVIADPVQLQRVADLMQEGGMLAKPLNVAPLVVQ